MFKTLLSTLCFCISSNASFVSPRTASLYSQNDNYLISPYGLGLRVNKMADVLRGNVFDSSSPNVNTFNTTQRVNMSGTRIMSVDIRPIYEEFWGGSSVGYSTSFQFGITDYYIDDFVLNTSGTKYKGFYQTFFYWDFTSPYSGGATDVRACYRLENDDGTFGPLVDCMPVNKTFYNDSSTLFGSFSTYWKGKRLRVGWYVRDSLIIRDFEYFGFPNIWAVNIPNSRGADGSYSISFTSANQRTCGPFIWRAGDSNYSYGYDIGFTAGVNSALDTEENINAVFGILGKAINSFSTLLSTRVFGAVTIGMLICVPLVGLVVALLFKFLKG